ncbi:MAG TPA: alpha/beta family hydrolase [Acidimicrobiia bacterium]
MTGIETTDGLTLEALWTDAAVPPVGVVVFCHPDPRRRGTMQAPLMRSVARSLGAAGLHVLRFNFRGVGGSEGSWGGGRGEIDDVDAAVAAASSAHPRIPLGIAGWSFGAVMALRWQARERSTSRYVGIAPAIGLPDMLAVPAGGDLTAADRLFVIGDRDQFTPAWALADYAASIGGRLEVMSGCDHFFYFRHDRLAAVVAAHLGGRASRP